MNFIWSHTWEIQQKTEAIPLTNFELTRAVAIGCADDLQLQNLTGYTANVANCSSAITQKKLQMKADILPSRYF